MELNVDVAIIGGGPGGTTVGTLLAKYNPRLDIAIFEREKFPREHIGESQLPLIAKILNEMEVWDKVEAAGFPIKVGGTYRWGRTDDLWDFDFIPEGKLHTAPRPGTYTGQRTSTAFQVDRAIYDEILLNHAASMGCTVRQSTAVREVRRTGDRVDSLLLADGTAVKARYYIDCSGNSGILRRAMEIGLETPTNLQNIAIWNYWTNAEWAVSIGVGGTRIQVLAQDVGWLWFIPLGAQLTSIGLVIPARYYKESGKKAEELYYEALSADKIVSTLTRNATHEEKVRTTRDWSYVADRLAGENWFLVGESAGFADPILSAGMSLTHAGAREVAYAILAMDRGDYDADWLKSHYSESHRKQIRQHIRFADYWYTARGVFPDLHDHAQTIAKDAGLEMSPKQAWQWLGQGGFIDESGNTDFGFFGALAAKELISAFSGEQAFYAVEGKTHFLLDVDGAEKDWGATLKDGRITRYRAYRRGQKVLPMINAAGWLAKFLKTEKSFTEIVEGARAHARSEKFTREQFLSFWGDVVTALESMVSADWVKARTEEGAEPCPRIQPQLGNVIHSNQDVSKILSEA